MTPEELDEARAIEAQRRWAHSEQTGSSSWVIAARLAREGWTPPEPVDPDLLIAREASAQEWEGRSGDSDTARRTRNGWVDDGKAVTACLFAARMAREQEQERAKALVEYVTRLVDGFFLYADYRERATEALAAYKAGKAAR
jgi:hypothetical protein